MKKEAGRPTRILRAILARLRDNRPWRVSTQPRQLRVLEQAIEDVSPGLLPAYPTARQAYLRKAMEVF